MNVRVRKRCGVVTTGDDESDRLPPPVVENRSIRARLAPRYPDFAAY